MLWGALFQNLLSKILLSIYKAQLSLSEISSSSAVRSPSSKLLKITYIIMGEFEMIDNLKCQKLPLRTLYIISALFKKNWDVSFSSIWSSEGYYRNWCALDGLFAQKCFRPSISHQNCKFVPWSDICLIIIEVTVTDFLTYTLCF